MKQGVSTSLLDGREFLVERDARSLRPFSFSPSGPLRTASRPGLLLCGGGACAPSIALDLARAARRGCLFQRPRAPPPARAHEQAEQRRGAARRAAPRDEPRARLPMSVGCSSLSSTSSSCDEPRARLPAAPAWAEQHVEAGAVEPSAGFVRARGALGDWPRPFGTGRSLSMQRADLGKEVVVALRLLAWSLCLFSYRQGCCSLRERVPLS
jgi:hypothetical protein